MSVLLQSAQLTIGDTLLLRNLGRGREGFRTWASLRRRCTLPSRLPSAKKTSEPSFERAFWAEFWNLRKDVHAMLSIRERHRRPLSVHSARGPEGPMTAAPVQTKHLASVARTWDATHRLWRTTAVSVNTSPDQHLSRDRRITKSDFQRSSHLDPRYRWSMHIVYQHVLCNSQ